MIHHPISSFPHRISSLLFSYISTFYAGMDQKKLLLFRVNTIIFLLLVEIGSCVDKQFEACEPSSCGKGPNISYPFWISGKQESFCGFTGAVFNLSCNDYEPIIILSGDNYIIRNISYEDESLWVSKADLSSDICSLSMKNLTLDDSSFHYSGAGVDVVFFFDCIKAFPEKYAAYSIDCTGGDLSPHSLVFFRGDPLLDDVKSSNTCNTSVIIPLENIKNLRSDSELSKELIVKGLDEGFHMRWHNVANCSECHTSGGRCGFDDSEYKFMCYCPDRVHAKQCQARRDVGKVIGIAIGAGLGVVLLAFVLFFVYRRRKKLQSKSSALISRSLTPDSSLKPDLEKGSSYFQTPIFSYNELQEATNNFDSSKEIGDGGFGTVYYGKLKDGRVVAVKRLYENNYKRVEQFMNEITILSRLRHQNLVTLYGCTSRHSRELLLVYEYVPNGTVADHLHGERAATSPLPWPVRMSIAIETADAIAYLHASDTIHRDVKTNNILLDNNFQVKVADFGLSRLFPTDVTHVSTAPQGTPGYVDPEYYQCYQLNDKSDVYSFGVVLIEIISSKPAVDIGRHRHEINLSNMAINKIQSDALHELVDPSLGFETDYSLRRMVTMVAELAFRCLQQEKDMRPSMSEVLQSLREIKSEEFKGEKEDEVDSRADARLLKNIPPFSPTSVTDKWVSNATTPNTSG